MGNTPNRRARAGSLANLLLEPVPPGESKVCYWGRSRPDEGNHDLTLAARSSLGYDIGMHFNFIGHCLSGPIPIRTPYAVEHLLLHLALRIATQVKRQSPANLTAVASRADYQ
jgi:hypothetical protein